jgi:flagellin-like protein
MENKKGVSPIVATVLLVAIVIIIAIVLWFWYNQFIDEQAAKAESQLAQECSKSEIQIRELTCEDLTAGSPSTYRLTMNIANTGGARISKLIINTRSLNISQTDEIAKTIQEGTTADITVDINASFIISIEGIQVVPAVSIGQNLKYCNEQAQESNPPVCA